MGDTTTSAERIARNLPAIAGGILVLVLAAVIINESFIKKTPVEYVDEKGVHYRIPDKNVGKTTDPPPPKSESVDKAADTKATTAALDPALAAKVSRTSLNWNSRTNQEITLTVPANPTGIWLTVNNIGEKLTGFCPTSFPLVATYAERECQDAHFHDMTTEYVRIASEGAGYRVTARIANAAEAPPRTVEMAVAY